MKEQLHFEVDVGGLASIFLQKEYENIINKYNDLIEKNIKHSEIDLLSKYFRTSKSEYNIYEIEKEIIAYPLFDEWANLSNEDVEKLLNNYVIAMYKRRNKEIDEVFLTEGLLIDFAKDFMRKKIKEHETVKLEGKTITKRREMELEIFKSYVYDKKEDVLIQVEFGGHFGAVDKIMMNKFGKFYRHEVETKTCDEYYHNNIVLKGESRNKEWYRDILK